MKFRTFTTLFVLLLFLVVTVYAFFEILVKAALWLTLLFILLVTGGLLMVIINPFSEDFINALSSKKLLRD